MTLNLCRELVQWKVTCSTSSDKSMARNQVCLILRTFQLDDLSHYAELEGLCEDAFSVYLFITHVLM